MKNKYNFVIPFYLPWNWSADYQRQTCLELAKKFKVIAYMKKDSQFFLKALFSKQKSVYPAVNNVKFYIPYDLIPFRRFKWIEKLNDYLSFKIMEIFYMQPNQKYLWIFDPVFYPLIKIFKGKTIYDCVDYLFVNEKALLKTLRSLQRRLIKESDYFFVNSNALKSLHEKIRKPTAVVVQGFAAEEYESKATSIRFPKEKPIIGFIGAINQRINFKHVKNLVKNHPEWNFVLWGRVQDNSIQEEKKTLMEMKALSDFKNFITGYSERKKLPGIVRQFDVAMIPYDITQEFNKFCFPMKLFEYFYLGKKVVSTPILELGRFPRFVHTSNNIKQWESAIMRVIKNPPNIYEVSELKKLALENSWSSKVGEIIKIIDLN